MANLSNHLESLLLAWAMTDGAATRPTEWHVALGTGSTDAGLTGEPSGDGYARQAATWTVAGSTAENAGALLFGPCTGTPWGTISHVAVFDAATGGNMLWHGPLAEAQTIGINGSVTVAAGAITLALD